MLPQNWLSCTSRSILCALTFGTSQYLKCREAAFFSNIYPCALLSVDHIDIQSSAKLFTVFPILFCSLLIDRIRISHRSFVHYLPITTVHTAYRCIRHLFRFADALRGFNSRWNGANVPHDRRRRRCCCYCALKVKWLSGYVTSTSVVIASFALERIRANDAADPFQCFDVRLCIPSC